MHIANDPELLIKLIGNTPVRLVLGNFDGVHLGHRRLLKELVTKAYGNSESSVVVTFNPHPAQYFARNSEFKKINTPAQQHQLLAEIGVTGLLELKFDENLASMSGQKFIENILEKFLLKEVIVGYDFRFGMERIGDANMLAARGKASGFEVTLIEAEKVDGIVASSSRVRSLLADEGDVEAAGKILGRHFCLVGKVIKGDQIGRTIGVPTANISEIHQIIPKNGVYSGRLKILTELSSEIRSADFMPCVINIGIRPTISTGQIERRLEAHIFDTNGAKLDIYDEQVEVCFLKRLRDEKRFENLEALKEQIELDIAKARG